MATQPAPLSDEELYAARLEIDDPLAMPNLCMDRPPRELTPEIVGEYHLPAESDFIWCCHCQGHHHRNGFVITNATGKNYLLGSDCGPKHYDLSFKLARREHTAKVKRRGVLERLKAIVATAPVVQAAIREILHSEGLARLDAKREELRKASPDALSALATSVATGMPLYELVTVRDHAAEQRRAEYQPEGKDGPPIYIKEQMSLGQIAGPALLRTRNDCRDVLLGLKGAINRVLAIHKEITDNFNIRQLTTAVREAEEAWREAQEAIHEVQVADAFFTEGNLNRLERWTANNNRYRLWGEDGKLVASRGGGRQTVIEPLPPLQLPPLPPLREKN
jgi:hypothetical protein